VGQRRRSGAGGLVARGAGTEEKGDHDAAAQGKGRGQRQVG